MVVQVRFGLLFKKAFSGSSRAESIRSVPPRFRDNRRIPTSMLTHKRSKSQIRARLHSVVILPTPHNITHGPKKNKEQLSLCPSETKQFRTHSLSENANTLWHLSCAGVCAMTSSTMLLTVVPLSICQGSKSREAEMRGCLPQSIYLKNALSNSCSTLFLSS